MIIHVSLPHYGVYIFLDVPFPSFLSQCLRLLTEAVNLEGMYRKIPKISPSTYKPSPPRGACTLKIALKYKVKQSKNGKFTSKYIASPIDFKTQSSLRK